tara:strand:+ start:12626 stop:13597 length:972 start_codon:yes stop_codon:yes gene_type:complete
MTTLVNQERFISMMEYTRPHGGESECEYLEKFIKPNCDWVDEEGNHIRIIGNNPNILFSSHTDTVHRHDGKQTLMLDQEGRLFSDSTCLGGDDTVGNYLMLGMMEKKIEGMYIFHRGEERGGIGSGFIAEETPKLVKDIEMAVAFDRKGTQDIIQYQNCERCCSEQFAGELANLLGMDGGDEIGSFTDTANYTQIIKECTNVSVGYFNQHSKDEHVIINDVSKIEASVLGADWGSLKAYGYEPEKERYHPLNVDYQNDYSWYALYQLCAYDPRLVSQFLYEQGYSAMQIEIDQDQSAYEDYDVSGAHDEYFSERQAIINDLSN